MRIRTTIAVACSLVPLTAAAQIAPVGTEFQVASYTLGSQAFPAVAVLADGGFVATWSTDRDGSASSVSARRYDSAGQAVGTDFQVNSYTLDYQRRPAVAATADGSFVVAWISYGQDGDSSGIFGQRYDSAGQAAGTEFQVNSYTLNVQGVQSQGYPTVAAAADGAFVVAWISGDQDGEAQGIFAQRYDSAGQKNGAEFQVNTYTSGDQYEPSVAARADGAFVVAWMSRVQDGSANGIFGQRYDSAGQRLGTEFQVNTYTPNDQVAASVATGANGAFVVVWISDSQDGSGWGVFAQRYNSVGQKAGAEFQVNTYTPGQQSYPPVVAAGADGAFLVVWRSEGQDADGNGVFARYYTSAGQAAGTEFQVNTYTPSDQWYLAASAGPNGTFVVAWASGPQDGDSDSVFAQRLQGPIAICGDNVVDPGEDCDSTPDCDPNCTFTGCGNGIVTVGEDCDDGNTLDGDGCSSTCQEAAIPEMSSDPSFIAGETLDTDTEMNGATEADPIETSIAMSVGTASATIDETSGTPPEVPGYSFFGQQVEINFSCPVGPCPSPTQPLMIAFRIDASRVPNGVDFNTFALFRDGVLVPACTGAPGVASPDPCVDTRQGFGDGDIGATVLTSLASVWTFARAACSAAPISCANPGGAILKVKKTTGDPSATKLLWKWLHGTVGAQPDFGDPLTGTSYTMCVYDDASLVESHVVAPGGDCDGKDCWKALGTKGFKYKNKAGNDAGITKVLLKSGAGKAKILVLAKGANVAIPDSDPIYTQASQVTVQLVAATGSCWQAVYPNPAGASGAEQFSDKF